MITQFPKETVIQTYEILSDFYKSLYAETDPKRNEYHIRDVTKMVLECPSILLPEIYGGDKGIAQVIAFKKHTPSVPSRKTNTRGKKTTVKSTSENRELIVLVVDTNGPRLVSYQYKKREHLVFDEYAKPFTSTRIRNKYNAL